MSLAPLALGDFTSWPVHLTLDGLAVMVALLMRGWHIAVPVGIIVTIGRAIIVDWSTSGELVRDGFATIPRRLVAMPDFISSRVRPTRGAQSLYADRHRRGGACFVLALVIVGYLMIRTLSEGEKIYPCDLTFGLPAVMTGTIMPLTYSIGNSIGAGYVPIRVVRGEVREVHLLVHVVNVVFAVYFV